MWYLSSSQHRNLSRPRPYLKDRRIRLTFSSKTISHSPSMRTGPEFPLVSVPVVRSRVQTFFVISLHQLIEIVHPHTSCIAMWNYAFKGNYHWPPTILPRSYDPTSTATWFFMGLVGQVIAAPPLSDHMLTHYNVTINFHINRNKTS